MTNEHLREYKDLKNEINEQQIRVTKLTGEAERELKELINKNINKLIKMKCEIEKFIQNIVLPLSQPDLNLI